MEIRDVYNAAGLKRRSNPVVWTDNHSLFDFDRSKYEKTGYAKLSGLIGAHEVQAITESAERLRDTECTSIVRENNGRIRSIFDVHRLSGAVREILLGAEGIVRLSEYILGSPIYVHQCHINYKTPGNGGEFDWHSDYTFWHWEDGMPRPRAISIMVFLDRVGIESGPLLVIPGSHFWFTHTNWARKVNSENEAIRHGFSQNKTDEGLIDQGKLQVLASNVSVEAILGEPGDVFIMDANLAHASPPNMGFTDRRMLFLCLNSIENTLGAPRSGGKARPTYISSRSVEPLMGGMVSSSTGKGS